MNFKRKKRKSARAGCLLCKPWKANDVCPRHRNMTFGNFRRYASGADQLRCEGIAVSGKWGTRGEG